MINAVLFDLDGTLLDTADDLSASLNHVLIQHGLPTIDNAIARPLASDGAKGLLELGFGDLLPQFDYEELRASFLQYYDENIAVNTQLYSGIEQLIASLDKAVIPWGIVTNKPEALAKKLIAYYPALKNSKVLFGGDSLPQRKPDPMPIILACDQLSATPENTLYVGDALRDIQASNSAKSPSVVANWGYIKATDDVSKWQANYIADTPGEILQLIN